MLFCLSLVVVERDQEALPLKQAENSLWDLDPRPLNACIGAMYTSDLDDLVEFEEVWSMQCVQGSIMTVPCYFRGL